MILRLWWLRFSPPSKLTETEFAMWACRLSVACALLLGALPTQAFERPLSPTARRGTNIVVNDTQNDQGEIDRVWIPAGAEIRMPA
ncbi:MAG TPA: hypothetical protein VL051_10640 [Burkholderiaceae bacterium]|nr:hypothetical protein [Burkholderiaceae bacterium]